MVEWPRRSETILGCTPAFKLVETDIPTVSNAVAKVVQSNPRKLRVTHDRVERLREPIRVNRLAKFVGEDEVALVRPNVGCLDPLDALPLAMRLQGVQRDGIDRDSASTLARFRWADVLVAAHGRQRLDDRQRSTREVDVLPPKAEHLASAHPCRRQEDERHRQTLSRQRLDEPLDLVG